MERLTEWRGGHGAVVNNQANYIDRLAAYEDAEEQGRLLVLPCKVGDMVYALWPVPSNAKFIPYCAEIKQIKIAKRACRTMVSFLLESVDFRGRLKEYFDDEFGKTVFLTREEAERALEGMG